MRAKVPFVSIVTALVFANAIAAATTSVRVTATVVPFILQNVEGVPESVTITPDDVAAGQVDVRGIRLVVKSNDPIGYVIAFRLRTADFQHVEVRGLEEQLRLGKGGGFAIRHLERIAFETYDLSYRITLPPNTAPGTYAFPVDVTAYRLSP